ncbi:MAG: aryldialkylphosphatase [Hyphomonas sp.]|uniref:phosphotriesterase family protein n=1 Tax=Hyphomonas sp. TaxID=87 RepID=UPI00184C12CB|nr:hypothetical protein [Hyphomonas sp.]MBA3069109.1 aryldialkylphosphatase [Hyphomonas sp.]MBU3919504.1 aryldialkylphosphatase [Alphaproteobacteria bacterium]MBU4061524.1 aryldialkylphosphatase [Alphaproteobacteria bacterium]MBU4165382.1 aryldialkylphosphatase [Alphaproteobacteria bacterium]
MKGGQYGLSGKVQTVTGLIDPIDVGPCLMHEHILCDIRPPDYKLREPIGYDIPIQERFAIDYGEFDAPGNLVLNDVDQAIDEINFMLADGGRTIVDLSCGGLHPDPVGLKKIAEATGANIVIGCGYYVHDYQDDATEKKTVDELCSDIISQVTIGAWGSDVRAGIIGEIGCQSPWTDLEKRIMEAAIIAQHETGASLAVHPGRHEAQPQEIADFAAAQNANMSRLIVSHIDRTIFDEARLFRLADSGVVLEFDLFGMETSYYKWNEAIDMPNDAVRLRWIRSLIDRGHIGQILIAHDICYRTRLKSCGGHGYGHIFRNVLPIMKRRSFTDQEIEQILVRNPARLLSFL